MPHRDGANRHGGLAGWIYADLALLLFIIAIGAWSLNDESLTLPPTTTTTTSTTIAAATDDQSCGAGSRPIEIELPNASVMSPESLRSEIGEQMDTLSGRRGLRFNIVLVYSGTGSQTDRASRNEAKQAAFRDIVQPLLAWDRFTDQYTGGRWYEPLIDIDRPVGAYKLKIFPLYCAP